ncbi:hypothetical protein GCK72_011274 [Caenorhabditis remanei]|uniref:3'-5' exonuclease domain-containing protein n=1 Tax=Caenorhabditis remanei TaxID=31234 RepID=A0A6A5H7I5_CAERE|nr:hypothetical protein GCK72_011274 [Caenorhabditis remanei]KAF1763009.1 hypothetical protein GCK72_011274 [Caenorhabditis remanei]
MTISKFTSPTPTSPYPKNPPTLQSLCPRLLLLLLTLRPNISRRFEGFGRSKLDGGVRFSPGAIRDILYFGGQFGFSRGVGVALFELIRDNNDLIELDAYFLRKLERVLVRRSINVYRTLPYEQFPTDYSYDKFDHINHHTTSNFAEIVKIMQNELRVGSSWPLYIDAEGTYSQLLHGSRLALITIFDVDSRMVYPVRTHHMSYEQLQSIRREMRIVAINRLPIY